MATAADVPNKYDIVIDGQGYVFLNSIDESLPFRVQRAIYSYSPTFITRQNVSGAYGDDQQAFWLTASQNDWSLGEDQRFFRGNDADRRRRYWQGFGVHPFLIPGQVSNFHHVLTLGNTSTNASSITTAPTDNEVGAGSAAGAYVSDTTTLYSYNQTIGTQFTLGLHGLGAQPSLYGMASDQRNVFITTLRAGSVGVRRYDLSTSTFSTFSATGADSLLFLNNSLFGYKNTTAELIRYDSGGGVTSLYTWKDSVGAAVSLASSDTSTPQLYAFGGKLLILRPRGERNCGELWIYDGVGTSKIAELPTTFTVGTAAILEGTIFVSGINLEMQSESRSSVWYMSNGTTGFLWKSPMVSGFPAVGNYPGIAVYSSGLLFDDLATNTVLFYNMETGGIARVGGNGTLGPQVVSNGFKVFFIVYQSPNVKMYPTSQFANPATLTTSLFDFDSSLNKVFRGVTVDFDNATTGDGGSMDVAFQVNSVDGTFTTLKTTAVSGTEYPFPSNTVGRSVSIKITSNLGTSTRGPVLKKIYVRAAPLLQSYRHDEFILDLTGRDGVNNVELRDGTDHPLDGLAQATLLRTSIASTTPISVTDRFGTFTGYFEPENCDIFETRPEEFVARVRFREI